MFLAYVDEIGETGAFVSPDHARFNTSPAFGYAGFLIPESEARNFGAHFTQEKRRLFKTEIEHADHPGRWEKKGSAFFYSKVATERPQNLRVFHSLVRHVCSRGGKLFYYADEKPIGTPKQTNTGTNEFFERESDAMREVLNRIARHVASCDERVLVMIDQINEKSRVQRLPIMYEHILGRSSTYDEMRRIIEPPMHIDSQLSSNIQFADWVAAFVGRAIDFQLIRDSKYAWITDPKTVPFIDKPFTFESKIHFWKRDLDDLNHSQILSPHRKLYPKREGSLMNTPENREKLERVRRATSKE